MKMYMKLLLNIKITFFIRETHVLNLYSNIVHGNKYICALQAPFQTEELAVYCNYYKNKIQKKILTVALGKMLTTC